jgi:hypothetical protein
LFRQVAEIKKQHVEEDMTLPPSFPQSFYRTLNNAAKKAGMARAAFAIKAIRFYSAALEKQKSPSRKALGSEGAEQFADLSRKVMKSWWSKLTPEERTARAKTAAEGRWGKKKK